VLLCAEAVGATVDVRHLARILHEPNARRLRALRWLRVVERNPTLVGEATLSLAGEPITSDQLDEARERIRRQRDQAACREVRRQRAGAPR
jgi:hypothetical protein